MTGALPSIGRHQACPASPRPSIAAGWGSPAITTASCWRSARRGRPG